MPSTQLGGSLAGKPCANSSRRCSRRSRADSLRFARAAGDSPPSAPGSWPDAMPALCARGCCSVKAIWISPVLRATVARFGHRARGMAAPGASHRGWPVSAKVARRRPAAVRSPVGLAQGSQASSHWTIGASGARSLDSRQLIVIGDSRRCRFSHAPVRAPSKPPGAAASASAPAVSAACTKPQRQDRATAGADRHRDPQSASP